MQAYLSRRALCEIFWNICHLVIPHSRIFFHGSSNFVITYDYRFCRDTPDEAIIPVSALECALKLVIIRISYIVHKMWMKKVTQ